MKNLIRFDWAVKRLLRNKANFKVIEGFLSELLREDIKIQSILESESNQRYYDDKYNRFDMLVENSKGELIAIEIQNNTEHDYFQRMIYGTSKLLIDHLFLGEEYDQLKKVISINIVYFDLGQGEDYVYYGKTNFHGLHKNDTLQLSEKQKELYIKKAVAEIFPEYYIIKVNNFDESAKDTLDEWIYYFKTNIIKDNFTAKGLKEAKEILKEDNLPDDEISSYRRYLEDLRYQASMAKSMKIDAIDRIKKDKAIEIAKKCLQKGLSIDEIAELTGLSMKEISEL
jgi:predicted transposase/invertase (TIGR01784 family)